ncbi:MAG: ABC transporter substrate-binding protein [Patescibacteria group bacterium]|nr:ABC transporter substrate-binding protein [Patescibacteria group bacterium]MDW8279609.1 ABC transporter substrate-binding protein [bacterium]
MIDFFKKIYLNLTLKEKRLVLFFLILFLISAFVLIFIFFQKSTISVPKSGGAIRLGIIGQPANINFVLAKNQSDNILINLLFAPLSKLADKIEPVNDSNLWRLRLKENLFWSDGKKITSDDIVFTIFKIKEAQDNSLLYPFWKNIEAERLSELEVQFKLGEKYSFFSEILNNFYIVPKHIFADLPVLNWNLSEYNFHPISNGKYIVDSINISKSGFISEIILKINKYYLEQKPYINQINIKFYPNQENLFKAFNNGEIDVFPFVNLNDFSKLDFKRPFNIFSFPVLNYYGVFINQSKNLGLKDLNVRRAMFISLDRSELVNKVFNGFSNPAFNPLPWFNDFKIENNFNLDEANKILDESGWKLNDSKIREKKIKDTLIQLNFKLHVPDSEFLIKTADILAESWSKIGIKIEIIKSGPDELLEKNIMNRDYELIIFGNAIYPNFNLYPFWHSSFIFYPGLNLALYSNNKVDDLLINLYQKLNIDKNQILNNILENIYNDYPAIFLYQPKYLMITSKNIYGIKELLINNEEDMFSDINLWYLKTKRVFK